MSAAESSQDEPLHILWHELDSEQIWDGSWVTRVPSFLGSHCVFMGEIVLFGLYCWKKMRLGVLYILQNMP